MEVVVGDIWEYHRPDTVVGVPVNWTYNKQTGKAIMGRGVAAQYAERYPGVPHLLGGLIKASPRTPHLAWMQNIVGIPVKRHWLDNADLELIQTGLHALTQYDCKAVYLPLLGAGYGGLDPLASLTLMASILKDSRFCLVLKDERVQQKYSASFRYSPKANKRDRTLF